ncbi:MAG: phosphate regulon sensor histidine kinase PhoR [Bacterioplanes sp.]|nr:phosphate regulon sensor histidine kinase PhoR [Bacterioplanes sp.]
MFKQAWQHELFNALFPIIAGFLLAGSLGYWLEGLTLGLGVALCLMLLRLRALHRWSHEQGPAPQDNGMIGYSVDHIIRREQHLKKRLEQQQKQLQRYQQGIESLQDGVVIFNEEGYILSFNSAAATLLSLRRSDVKQHILNLIRSPHFVQYFNSRDFHQSLQFDFNQRSKRSLLVQITQFDVDKVMLVRDVTERKRVETMRQNFIADVSHELRTPLTVINGYLEMLSDMSLPPPLAKAIQQMDTQSQRMKTLVNDLIELSKLESLRHGDAGQWFDLVQLTRGVIDQLQEYGVNQLQLVHDAECEMLGFAEEIRAVLTNLTTNAIKYGGDEPITVTLSAQEDRIKVSVQDLGPGIASEHISHLTERFYRVDSSRESSVGGSGLGLAIVKHALEHHDCVLDIESTLGKGSCFSFVLPAQRSRIGIKANTAEPNH